MSTTAQTVFISPRRGMAGIVADCVIEEAHSDRSEITSHPIEFGANVTDNVVDLQAELGLTYGWTMSSDQNVDAIATYGPNQQPPLSNFLRDIYQQLLTLKKSATPFDVYTGKRDYKNMLIEVITHTTELETENSLIVRIQLREAQIVGTRTFVVPTDQTQVATPDTTQGTIARGTVQPMTNGSILANAGLMESDFQIAPGA